MNDTLLLNPDFIIVDDDHVNNYLSELIIHKVFPSADLQIFTDPHAGLKYIGSHLPDTNSKPTILFLDINMPTLSGWEFLEEFERYGIATKEQVRIYMLSSSIDPTDTDRIANSKIINGYITKPLTAENVKKAIGQISGDVIYS